MIKEFWGGKEVVGEGVGVGGNQGRGGNECESLFVSCFARVRRQR